MDRRTFIGAIPSSLLALALIAKAQQAGTMYTIGYLSQLSKSDERAAGVGLALLVAYLRDLGYVERRNLTVESRFAGGRVDDLPALAAELVRANPKVIVVRTAGVAQIVLKYTRTIPIVALAAGELEAEASVKSLAKPGGNLTGMQLYSPEMMGKRLQLLQEVVPGLRRVAVLRGIPFLGPGLVLYREATDAAAATLGIRARYVEFERPEDLDRLFGEMVTEREQALLIWGNPHVYAHRKRIYDLTIRHRLPAIYDVAIYKEEGLLVYGAKMEAVLREAATYVDRILRGANPGDLPIGQPTKFELIVNLKTAKALGLPIPQSLLRRADEVIQ
jgi:putative ABC transport system substrate-binding protein